MDHHGNLYITESTAEYAKTISIVHGSVEVFVPIELPLLYKVSENFIVNSDTTANLLVEIDGDLDIDAKFVAPSLFWVGGNASIYHNDYELGNLVEIHKKLMVYIFGHLPLPKLNNVNGELFGGVEKSNKHVHSDIIHAYADGAAIQFFDKKAQRWIDSKMPQFDPQTRYRVKPKPMYPHTRLTNDELYSTMCSTTGSNGGYVNVANSAIEHFITSGQMNDYLENLGRTT